METSTCKSDGRTIPSFISHPTAPTHTTPVYDAQKIIHLALRYCSLGSSKIVAEKTSAIAAQVDESLTNRISNLEREAAMAEAALTDLSMLLSPHQPVSEESVVSAESVVSVESVPDTSPFLSDFFC